MCKLISHRGNIKGAKPERENAPSYIDTALSSGYDVEIDIRYVDDKFYLGHDDLDYEVSENWLYKRKEKLWIHCKNLEASSKLSKSNDTYKYFCHSSDSYVLTSNNLIWVHDLTLKLDNRCIIPLISTGEIAIYANSNKQIVHAICTDNISFASYKLKEKGLL